MKLLFDEKTEGVTDSASLQPSSRWDLVALGEVMLRFDPGIERIAQARNFRVWEGGGEYNVARGISRCFGLRASIVTALVDNSVGHLVKDLMLQGGVDLSHVLWREFDGLGRESRNGIYFLERGFGVRGSLGVMDRGQTAISQMAPGDFDWDALFADGKVRWFHTGGIMAALSESSTEVVREAIAAARRHHVAVSFDCNYRPSLWKKRGGRAGAIALNRALMPHIDVLFGHEGDLALPLIEASSGSVHHTPETFAAMAKRVAAEFPNLQLIASTVRRAESANHNFWGGFAFADGRVYEGLRFERLEIFDRVGGGDSFASGMIYGLLARRGIQWALDCGVAHGALTMTTPGDSSQVTLPEVQRLIECRDAGVQR